MRFHLPKSPAEVMDPALAALVYAIMLALVIGGTTAIISLVADLVLSLF